MAGKADGTSVIRRHEKPIKRIRYFIFLKDVLLLTLSAFGGPHAHLAMLIDVMVKKRGYLKEEELLELNALCQILPGPTSTQTITAIGFKIGGPNLAYLSLLVWLLPAFIIMTSAGILMAFLHEHGISTNFTKFLMPIAVGFVAFAAFRITKKVVNTIEGIMLMVVSAVISLYLQSPFIYPVLLLAGGVITAFKFKNQPIEEKDKFKIEWSNFTLWAMVLVFAAVLGGITKSLPIRLFENFYRNGSMIFGGGQVLIPLIYTEFVEFKKYLTSEEFLTGFGLVQAVPGPVFSFSAYIGALSMREYGIGGQILGALFSSMGIFLPGTFMIFFIIRFWKELKKYRIVKASIEGILAVSSGMVIAAGILLFEPIPHNFLNYAIVGSTFLLLMFTRIPAPLIVFAGILLGLVL
jgi:chromate transporter